MCPLSIPVWMTASLNKHLTAGPGRRDAFTWGQEDPDPRYWSFQDQAATGCHSCHVHVHILSKSILESIMDIARMCFEKAVYQSVMVSNINIPCTLFHMGRLHNEQRGSTRSTPSQEILKDGHPHHPFVTCHPWIAPSMWTNFPTVISDPFTQDFPVHKCPSYWNLQLQGISIETSFWNQVETTLKPVWNQFETLGSSMWRVSCIPITLHPHEMKILIG